MVVEEEEEAIVMASFRRVVSMDATSVEVEPIAGYACFLECVRVKRDRYAENPKGPKEVNVNAVKIRFAVRIIERKHGPNMTPFVSRQLV